MSLTSSDDELSNVTGTNKDAHGTVRHTALPWSHCKLVPHWRRFRRPTQANEANFELGTSFTRPWNTSISWCNDNNEPVLLSLLGLPCSIPSSLRRVAAKFEWGMTYLLVRDERGIAPKNAIRGVFDGSFFEYMELTVNSRPHQY